MIRRALALLIVFAVLSSASALGSSDDLLARGDEPTESAVLTPADRTRYAEIFRLQEAGHWQEADRHITELSSRLLMGHVLAQRYLHPTKYRARFDELARWLESYADHPQAQRIYRLARKRKPDGSIALRDFVKKPHSLSLRLPPPPAYRSALRLSHSQYKLKLRIQRKIQVYLGKTYLSKAERLLEDKKLATLLDRYELDEAYADLAAGWLYYGDTERALRLASEVAKRSGKDIPIAYWTAGLAAWKLDQHRHAAQHFMQLALSEGASDWNRAAGAYWTARASLKEINLAEAQRWLRYASQFPETFYGLLALRRLGEQPEFSFESRSPSASTRTRLGAYPEGQRAIALLEIGENARAEQELLWLDTWQRTDLVRQLARLANQARLPQLSFRLAQRLDNTPAADRISVPMQAIAYPLLPWRPGAGFKVDEALVLAFVRQESSFDPAAKSPDGARGLMQLMPRTASAISRATSLSLEGKQSLYNPTLNLDLGQNYLLRLLRSSRVGYDLLRLAVAYNAGPGNLSSWMQRMGPQEDPLLFLETLPSRETRLFAERVMTNLWIYRLRLGQATPSLDALAAGRWPMYRAQDPVQPQLVSAEADSSG